MPAPGMREKRRTEWRKQSKLNLYKILRVKGLIFLKKKFIAFSFQSRAKTQVVQVNERVRGKQQFSICSGYCGPYEEGKPQQEPTRWSSPVMSPQSVVFLSLAKPTVSVSDYPQMWTLKQEWWWEAELVQKRETKEANSSYFFFLNKN